MSENTVRIRVRLNDLEIECEGRETFVVSEVEELAAKMSETLEKYQHVGRRRVNVSAAGDGDGSLDAETKVSIPHGTSSVTTKTIATRMKAKNGTDLARAAARHLGLVEGRETFSRQELLSEMKTARGHYNENMRKGLTQSLRTLMGRSVLNETASETYALTPREEEETRSFLRGAQSR